MSIVARIVLLHKITLTRFILCFIYLNWQFLQVFSTMIVGDSDAEEMDVQSLLESLKLIKDDSKTIPTCISSVI